MKEQILIRCFNLACRRREPDLKVKVCPGTEAKPCGQPLADEHGRMRWELMYYDEHGRRHYVAVKGLHRTATAAHVALGKLIALHEDGFRPRATRSGNQLLDSFEEKVIHKYKHPESVRNHLSWWRGRIGHLKLAQISRDVVRKALDDLKETRKESTMNRFRSSMSAVFRHGMGLDWMTHNPFDGIPHGKENPDGGRVLNGEEIAKLLAACEGSYRPELRDAVILGLTVGARKSKLEELKWENVNLKERSVAFFENKNGEDLYVPLVGAAMDVLTRRNGERQLGPGHEFVFPDLQGKSNPLSWPLTMAVEKAGIGHVRFHDLRHTAASALGTAGVGALELLRIFGWRNIATALRYTKLDTESIRGAMERGVKIQ